MGLLLYLISYIIELPIYLANFFTVLWLDRNKKAWWRTINGYFYNGALSRDKFGNYNYRKGLNFWLTKPHYKDWGDGVRVIEEKPYPFGNPKETISSALGKNQVCKTLTWFGWFIVYLLWVIDVKYWFKGGHCINSIDKNI